MARLSWTLAACTALASCSASSPATTVEPPVPLTAVGRAYSAGDTLFRRDARWMGGDAAISIELSNARTLWLFGDSFVSLVTPATALSSGTPPYGLYLGRLSDKTAGVDAPFTLYDAGL